MATLQLIPISGQDSGGAVRALTGVTDASSDPINVSRLKPNQRDNRGRSLFVKITRHTVTGAEINIWGRHDTTDPYGWVPFFDLNRNAEITAFAVGDVGINPQTFGFVFGHDYREIYVESQADTGTVDYDVTIGS
jgi:hypothetical protein